MGAADSGRREQGERKLASTVPDLGLPFRPGVLSFSSCTSSSFSVPSSTVETTTVWSSTSVGGWGPEAET